ncbi:16S rRNA (cytosine(1402)-N(4))-methyltransferase RsmH [Sulfurimonas sp. HSL-1656]|uniref:16S rRNA (cytosine(1402)-N(4))-methyltransferase RsmH n=1 Tax=Thiomicrolovo subterrani TaxID=3131934 RepID=UPI0031F9C567
MQNIPHIPVLYREVTDAFSGCDAGIVVDCTMGYGGHSSLLLEANPTIRLIGIDQDETAIRFSTERLAPFGERVEIRKGRFSAVLEEIVRDYGAEQIRGVLADIGVSSLQLDEKERGFSFESETLDMRMDPSAPLDAATVVNTYAEAELERILRDYGEVPNARKVAQVIAAQRPFSSAKALAEAVRPYAPRGKKIHPATLVMQAIRIEVNDELGELNRLLDVCERACFPDALIGIISFHSLEDRIVKQRFAQWSRNCICPSDAMRCTCGNNHALGRPRPKKPITALPDELKQNPRSRSAKLRLFEMNCHGR